MAHLLPAMPETTARQFDVLGTQSGFEQEMLQQSLVFAPHEVSGISAAAADLALERRMVNLHEYNQLCERSLVHGEGRDQQPEQHLFDEKLLLHRHE